jgi:hypothetical protein
VANEILRKLGTELRFCVSGSFSPADPATDWTIGSPTNVLITLASVADAAGRQSDKADLGATFAAGFRVLGCVDFTGETPGASGHIDYYWAPSTSVTAANGNVAGNSGVDGAAPDGALGGVTLGEFIIMCDFIGSLRTHDGACVQNGVVNNYFVPSSRYGQLVLVNNSGDSFEGDDVEANQVFIPLVDEIQ